MKRKAYLYGAEIAEIIAYYDDVVVLRLVGDDFNTVAMMKEIVVEA